MPRRIRTNSFYKLYLNIVASIAFVPAIIALALFLMALLTLSVDQFSPESLVGYKVEIKNVIYPDSARSLLSTIAGGLISLMVFSFSMVMVVLNQTASNYSPRVLPSLIGHRSHQIIMGVYLGTIAYTFMVLSSIQSKAYTFAVPSLSIIINAILSLVCLALFVSFIRSISENIQIGNIINSLYNDTSKSLELNMEKKIYISGGKLPQTDQWMIIKSPFSGYFDDINERLLLRRTKSMDITLKMMVSIGGFVNQRDPFFQVNRHLSEDEQEKVFQTFVFRHQEIIQQNYIYGFKHLAEIAIKALSPGINDPGTAIQAIDRLTGLFIIGMKLHGFPVLKDDEQKLRLIYQPVPMEDIFYFSFSSIKNYTGNDVSVMHKLLYTIKAMVQNDDEEKFTVLLLMSIQDALEQFMPEIKSTSDQQKLTDLIDKIMRIFPDHPQKELTLKWLIAWKKSYSN